MSDHDELIRALFATTTDTVVVDVLRREIWIDGDIEPGVFRDVVRGLRQLVQLGNSPIEIFVNSNGGSASDGLAIADYMKYLTSQSFVISTKVMGVAYSAGALIACAGTPGHRYTLPSSRYLVHQISASGVEGKIKDIQSDVRNLEALNREIIKHVTDSTKQPIRIVIRDLKEETYMSAEQAKAYGLVDHIISISKEK